MTDSYEMAIAMGMNQHEDDSDTGAGSVELIYQKKPTRQTKTIVSAQTRDEIVEGLAALINKAANRLETTPEKLMYRIGVYNEREKQTIN